MPSTPPIPTSWLAEAAARSPEAVAIRDHTGREIDYAGLFSRAKEFGRGIAIGSGRSELCAIDLPPGLDHAVAMHACMLRGVPFQTLRPGLPRAERDRLLESVAMVVGAGGRERSRPDGEMAHSRPAPGPDQVLCRVLSSGTSGRPKPVDLTWGNHFASASASASVFPLAPGVAWLCCLPLDHVGGLSILIRAAIGAACAVVHPSFDVEAVSKAIQWVDYVSLVPTQLARLLVADAPLDRPAGILLGGAPVPAEMIEEALGRGARLFPTYGLTEACSQVCTLGPDEVGAHPGSVGRALPGIEVEIDGGAEVGEILVGGPTVAPTARAADRRLHTGDLGRLDADGRLWVQGRADDLIISGGENVLPEEVEAALLEHPSVVDAGVAGRDDPEWGQAVVAWVQSSDSDELTAVELIEHCRALLAPAKVPKRIEMVDRLPRTATGKLKRHRLG